MSHYAMIPMEEYQEFMEWKKSIPPSIRRTKAMESDDLPF